MHARGKGTACLAALDVLCPDEELGDALAIDSDEPLRDPKREARAEVQDIRL